MFRLFFKHETDEQIEERLLKLCKEGDYGICSPPMDAKVAINELCNFFLGKDLDVGFPSGQEQAISEVVHEIEEKYRKCVEKRKIFQKKVNNNICVTPMNARNAIDELCEFFLGKGWYVVIPMGPEQVFTEIVYQIETNYKQLKAAT